MRKGGKRLVGVRSYLSICCKVGFFGTLFYHSTLRTSWKVREIVGARRSSSLMSVMVDGDVNGTTTTTELVTTATSFTANNNNNNNNISVFIVKPTSGGGSTANNSNIQVEDEEVKEEEEASAAPSTTNTSSFDVVVDATKDTSLHYKNTAILPLKSWEEECMLEGMGVITTINEVQKVSRRFTETSCQLPPRKPHHDHHNQIIPPKVSSAGTTLGHTFWRCQHVNQNRIRQLAQQFLIQYPIQLLPQQNRNQNQNQHHQLSPLQQKTENQQDDNNNPISSVTSNSGDDDDDDDDDDNVPPPPPPPPPPHDLSHTTTTTTTILDDSSQGIKCDICRIVELLRQLDLTISFVGDSVQAQIFQGFILELERRNYDVTLTNHVYNENFYKSRIHYNETIVIRSNEWNSNNNNNNKGSGKNAASFVKIHYYCVYMVPLQFKKDMDDISQSGDIMILGFGLHYNSVLPKNNKVKNGLQKDYLEGMKEFLMSLRSRSSSSSTLLGGATTTTTSSSTTKKQRLRPKLLLHRETTSQHFDSPNGDYGPWTHRIGYANQRYCKALSKNSTKTNATTTTTNATRGRFSTTVQQQQQRPNSSSSGNFRETTFQQAALQAGLQYRRVIPTTTTTSGYPSSNNNDNNNNNQQELLEEVTMLPFYDFTSHLHDVHPKPLKYDNSVDCTHYCPSPYLFQPLWRSLRLVMDEKFAGKQGNSTITQ